MLATKPAKLWRPSRTLCDCPVFTAVPLTRVCLCSPSATQVQVRKTIKIGRPGYRVVKQRDPESGQRSLLFEVQYPEIEEGLQPRHRFMGAYEQRVERADKNYQYVMPASAQLRAVFTPMCSRYLLVAAEPYETIGFKIPADEIDKSPGKFYTNWDPAKQVFTVSCGRAAHSNALGDCLRVPGTTVLCEGCRQVVAGRKAHYDFKTPLLAQAHHTSRMYDYAERPVAPLIVNTRGLLDAYSTPTRCQRRTPCGCGQAGHHRLQ